MCDQLFRGVRTGYNRYSAGWESSPIRVRVLMGEEPRDSDNRDSAVQ